MAYGQWCPNCGNPIVSVTRGIPSMGTCSNGHTTDRRDCLRRAPAKEDKEAIIEALTARAERAEAAISEALRRRDAWKAKAKGADAMEAALRAHVGNPGPPSLSRLLWAGLSAAETRRADRAEAALATARDDALEDAAGTVESLWAYRTCAEVAAAIRAMKGGDA